MSTKNNRNGKRQESGKRSRPARSSQAAASYSSGRGASKGGYRSRSAEGTSRKKQAVRGSGSYQGRSGHGARRGPASGSASGTGLIEGRRAAFEALESATPLKRALVQQGLSDDGVLDKLRSRLEEAGVPIEEVPRGRLDRLSSHGAHQGVILETRPFAYADVDEVIRAAGEGDALVLVLDHVTDEGNFGAIVRSAEVVGASGVIIASARAASVGVAAYKTSAGAVLHLPIAQVPNLSRALDQLKEAGFWVCAASEHAQRSAWEAPLDGRLCLVMGSEGSGVSSLLLKKCDFTCRLPQRGRIESLNVAQAATVLCYEWLRREESKGLGATEAASREGA